MAHFTVILLFACGLFTTEGLIALGGRINRTVLYGTLEVLGSVKQNGALCCDPPTTPAISITGIPATMQQYTVYTGTIATPWFQRGLIGITSPANVSFLTSQSPPVSNGVAVFTFFATQPGVVTFQMELLFFSWTFSYQVATRSVPVSTFFRWKVTAMRGWASTVSTGPQLSELRLYDAAGTKIPVDPAKVLTSYVDEVNVALNQYVANLVDDDLATKFYATWGGNDTTDAIFTFNVPTPVCQYEWYTADDVPNRDAVGWTFSTSNDGVAWTERSTITSFATTTLRYSLVGRWTIC